MFRNCIFLCFLSMFTLTLPEKSFVINELDPCCTSVLEIKQFCELFEDENIQKNTGWNSDMAALFLDFSQDENLVEADADQNIQYKIYTVIAISDTDEFDNKICGAVVCRFEKGLYWADEHGNYNQNNRANVGEIRILGVHKDFRQQGIATELIKQFEKVSAELGMNHIWMKVFSDNEAMIQCCLKLGYKQEQDSDCEMLTYMSKNIC